MTVAAIELDGEGFLVDFTFHPRNLFDEWGVDIHSVLFHGMAFHASDEWIKRAEAAILATHGTSLQDAAEEAYFEQQTGAYE